MGWGGVPVGGLFFCASFFLRIRLRSKEHRCSSTGTTRSSVVAAIAAQQSLWVLAILSSICLQEALFRAKILLEATYTRVRCEHRCRANIM